MPELETSMTKHSSREIAFWYMFRFIFIILVPPFSFVLLIYRIVSFYLSNYTFSYLL